MTGTSIVMQTGGVVDFEGECQPLFPGTKILVMPEFSYCSRTKSPWTKPPRQNPPDKIPLGQNPPKQNPPGQNHPDKIPPPPIIFYIQYPLATQILNIF